MPSDNEVLNVITGWSPKRPEKMSQGLEDWWNQTAPGSTHSTLKFDPDGIDDLLLRLKKAFPASPVRRSLPPVSRSPPRFVPPITHRQRRRGRYRGS